MIPSTKRLLRHGMLAFGLDHLVRRWSRHEGVVLMLHRCRAPHVEGIDPVALREGLEWIRKQGSYHFVYLDRFFSPDGAQAPTGKTAVAVTIDDGYRDQVEAMGAVLAAFDVPATLFVTTGFVDRSHWMWWDRIHFAFRHAQRRNIPQLAPGLHALSWEHPADNRSIADGLIEALKRVPDAHRLRALAALGDACEVEIPDVAPDAYGPASWDMLRAWEAGGLCRLAPHTVTHPILARLDDDGARWEIRESWRRLREEARAPSPIFCYPNGTRADFGEREMRAVLEAGLAGAVTAEPGLVGTRDRDAAPPALIDRHAFPPSVDDLRMIVSGIGGSASGGQSV